MKNYPARIVKSDIFMISLAIVLLMVMNRLFPTTTITWFNVVIYVGILEVARLIKDRLITSILSGVYNLHLRLLYSIIWLIGISVTAGCIYSYRVEDTLKFEYPTLNYLLILTILSGAFFLPLLYNHWIRSALRPKYHWVGQP